MSPEQNRKLLLIFAIAVIALNLRPAIASVGPLIFEIRDDTGLSNTLLGLLTTLPVLAFGLFSVMTPLFTRRFGTEGTMALALVLLTSGLLIRVMPSLIPLFLGTAILGVGIALGNTLLPGIVKKSFPRRFGLVTGIYSSMLGIGATIASAISVPLSEGAGLGWRWALGAWAAIAFIGLLVWLPQMKQNIPVIARRSLRQSLRQLGTSKLAWNVSIFVGLQSLTFYTIIAWLPEILIERGMSAGNAGYMLALTQGTGVIGTFVIPAWAARRQRQRLPIIILVALEIISLLGLMASSLFLVELWAAMLGFCLGGSFGLALLFLVLRTRDSHSANELSGMAQSIGYTIASFGPAFFGAVYDLTLNWTYPIAMLLLIAFAKLASGWVAGRDEVV
ncbi:MAG: MFS transporter [Balneolaceae bacterium]|nr:MAG: MFS transporter [Balneolaceae bacterium]